MRRSYFTLLVILLIGTFVFLNSHCASPEITSARLYIAQEKWEDALRSLEREIERNPYNADAWYLKGRVLYELGEFDRMHEAYDRYIELTDGEYEEINEIKFKNNKEQNS